jgi:TRAP-type mannitol/chloroaromatic compound transport system substrate-binding protein
MNEWNNLPELYQEALKTAAYEANVIMMARYDAKNPVALESLLANSEVQLLPFPDEVLAACEEAANELINEFASQDTDFGSILPEWTAFRDTIHKWFGVSELAFSAYSSAQAAS